MSSSDQPVPERRSGRADLVSRLGVTLDDALLDQALTHRSFAYENGGVPDNERLEFLGDSVLGQAEAKIYLYKFKINILIIKYNF